MSWERSDNVNQMVKYTGGYNEFIVGGDDDDEYPPKTGGSCCDGGDERSSFNRYFDGTYGGSCCDGGYDGGENGGEERNYYDGGENGGYDGGEERSYYGGGGYDGGISGGMVAGCVMAIIVVVVLLLWFNKINKGNKKFSLPVKSCNKRAVSKVVSRPPVRHIDVFDNVLIPPTYFDHDKHGYQYINWEGNQ